MATTRRYALPTLLFMSALYFGNQDQDNFWTKTRSTYQHIEPKRPKKDPYLKTTGLEEGEEDEETNEEGIFHFFRSSLSFSGL